MSSSTTSPLAMNNYSQGYGNYIQEEPKNAPPGDSYYYEEHRSVSGGSGMNIAQEDYDMYDDVDELLNDIGRYMRSKNMHLYSQHISSEIISVPTRPESQVEVPSSNVPAISANRSTP